PIWPVIPIIGSATIKVGLADLSPEFARVRAGIGIFPKPATDRIAIRCIEPRRPIRVYRAQRSIYRMTKLVDADAFMVVTVKRQAENVFFAETGRLAPRAANALVLVSGIRRMAVLWHVGINLVFADHNQIHAVAHHGRENVRPARQ